MKKNFWPWKKNSPTDVESSNTQPEQSTNFTKSLEPDPNQSKLSESDTTLDSCEAENNILQKQISIPNTQTAFFSRIKQGLQKTSEKFIGGLVNLLKESKEVNEEMLEEIETQLLLADIGINATTALIKKLRTKTLTYEGDHVLPIIQELKNEITSILKQVDVPFVVEKTKKPYVILVVGVNGAGKTTTIGKLAKRFQKEEFSVILAAGDTFRAAAVEQLTTWGERNNIQVISQQSGSDSASVIYDALESAKSKKVDILIADTAGRLHNKVTLMEELKKITRVMKKLDNSAPHEILLVLDAGTGQNAVNQALIFQEAVGVTGIALTKLDGTAKGGIALALSTQLRIPIRFVGVGEQIDDLKPFNSEAFADGLFNINEKYTDI